MHLVAVVPGGWACNDITGLCLGWNRRSSSGLIVLKHNQRMPSTPVTQERATLRRPSKRPLAGLFRAHAIGGCWTLSFQRDLLLSKLAAAHSEQMFYCVRSQSLHDAERVLEVSKTGSDSPWNTSCCRQNFILDQDSKKYFQENKSLLKTRPEHYSPS